VTGLAARLLAGVGLAVSAYVHLDLSSSPYAAAGQLTVGVLFLGQAVVAAAVALLVLARPSRASYAAAGLVAGASLLALVLSTYVRLPSVGPFPVLYEPVWYADKAVAAVAAGIALLGALTGLARRVR
jgi:hypothetical protein